MTQKTKKKQNSEKQTKKSPPVKDRSKFISYLNKLYENNNRGDLAALRRGLQYDPGACIEMYPYIIPWVKNAKSKWQADVHYIIAALFAYYPGHTREIGDFGDSFRKIQEKNPNNDSLEQRFTNLLRSDREDLHLHLRQAVSLAKSANIPVNWQLLYKDLLYWNNPKYPTYKRWANSFWKYKANQKKELKE